MDENDSPNSTPRTSVTTTPKNLQKGGEEWKSYSKDLVQRLLIDGVRDATASRDAKRLEQRLTECEENDLSDHKDVKKGKFVFSVIQQRKDLQKATDGTSVAAINREIKAIEQHPNVNFKKELQQDVIEARSRIDQLKRYAKKTGDNILAMDRKTMSEVRRYHKPPQMMKRIIQAALLLMGEDEYTTSDWSNCLKLLNPQGATGMSRKIMNFDPSKIHPEISDTAKYILTEEIYDIRYNIPVNDLEKSMGTKYKPSNDEQEKYWRTYDLTTIQSVSPAAATFYVWAMGVIDTCDSYKEEDESELSEDSRPTIPASISRQWQIFDRFQKPAVKSQLSPYARRKYPRNNERFLQKEQNGYVSYSSNAHVS